MVTALCNSKLGGLYTIFTPLCTLHEDKQLTPSELMSHHWWEECSADKGFVNAQVCFCSVRLPGPSHEIQTRPDCPSSPCNCNTLGEAMWWAGSCLEPAGRKSWALREKGKDPKSHLQPAGEYFCYREAGSIALGWERGDCGAWEVLYQRTSPLLLYSKPAATAMFYKPSSWNSSKADEWVDALRSSSGPTRKRNTDNNWQFCLVWLDSSHVASDGSAAPFYSNFIFPTF